MVDDPAEPGRSRGEVFARLLTSVAVLLAVVMATLAYCMATPVRWDGPGILGALALFFPLHLLLLTLLSAALTWVAHRSRARSAMWLFGFVAILTSIMALLPTLAIWRKARDLNVTLSLGTYFAHALHMNIGKPQGDKTVSYGASKDGTKLVLDVWRTGLPDTGPLRPALVFVHGGAWIHGTRSMTPDVDRWFNELGYEVFDVEYRMPPTARGQDEVADVKAAIGWVDAHAAEHHVDRERISVMGNSAGANLAMLAAYSMGDPDLPPTTDVAPVKIRSVISFYGPTDLALLHRECKSPEYVHAAFLEYIGGTPEEFPDSYRELSPLFHVGDRSPPTVTFLGASDRLVTADQAEELDEALGRAGVPHATYLLPGQDHGFETNWGGFGAQIARAKIREFLLGH